MLEVNETKQNLKFLADFKKEKGGIQPGDLIVDHQGRIDRIVLAAENLLIATRFGQEEQGLSSGQAVEFVEETEPFFIGIVRRGRI